MSILLVFGTAAGIRISLADPDIVRTSAALSGFGSSSGAGLPHLDGADRVEQHQDVERDVVADPEGQQQFEQYQEQD